ncbi:hypothetical protein BC939DRAFT_526884 [Gamsiella multidivaricata]|uniref:uncharacterized protein n=1 Tax=Gamsiella multidivaricata TaxID=101098 RepID=UPI00221F1BC8|nr:uncharacterized protein BC939DRAFT_526884 [Gamsiella multidivaricata]KAG0360351.1 hypothetical protein BGZ54_009589 [Gamsiella multidivaricata]KAI7827944.1 hypothetical protein BC939DRAFT_526884 [Gamsiella multidivaricata]
MNPEECIAALPRIEKGDSRDIFSPIPTRPEPYSLDLVQEYARFSAPPTKDQPTASSKQHESSPSQRTPQQQQQQQGQLSQKGGGNTSDPRYNCTVCKKSFGSEATWNNHQMSAKHIAAVKDAEKSKKNTNAKGGSKSGSTKKGKQPQRQRTKDAEDDQEQVSPEVTEALMSFRKVEKLVKENPGMAASVLWKIAKALWTYRQSLETARALFLLIQVLNDLQSGTGPASDTQSLPTPGSLSPTQISMTLYLSRLAFARLIVYHSPSVALHFYLDAIQGRWHIGPSDLQALCDLISTGSVPQLLDRCKDFLETHPKTEKLMASSSSSSTTTTTTTTVAAAATTASIPGSSTSSTSSVPTAAKKPTDPNLKLLTVLLEAASMISQHSSRPSLSSTPSTAAQENRSRAETSLTLFSMALVLRQGAGGAKDGNTDDAKVDDAAILRSMASVYKHLSMSSSAAACLIRLGELSRPQDDKDDKDDRVLWDLFQALLWAMEAGDFVRMQGAIRLVQSSGRWNQYQDIKDIVNIANAVISQDNEYLYNGVAHVLDHLSLLIEAGSDDDKSHLLLCRYNTSSASIDIIRRVKRLVT